jgi:hypothetical protein
LLRLKVNEEQLLAIGSDDLVRLGHKSFLLIFALIIVALLVDTSIKKISSFTGGIGHETENLTIFILMIVVYAVGQYLILKFLGGSHLHFQLAYVIVRLSQYVLIAILATIAWQIIFTGGYSSILLKAVVWINYTMLIILTGSLSHRFLLWSIPNKNKIVLAYAISMGVLSFSGIFTILYINNALSGQRDIAYIQSLKSPIAIVASIQNIFSSSYFVSSVAAFILTWFATILLLNHYSKKLGKIRYWILVLIPLVYFLSQFESIFLNLFVSFRKEDPILFGVIYTLIFSATKPVGGILFGIAFWSTSRNIESKVVKNYLIISAYGMILIFAANQPVGLTLIPYPPYGLVTISFLGLASYLVFIGIYSTSMSVALDTTLRGMIRKSTLDESKFIETIGTSEMEKLIERRVRAMISKTEANFKKEVGIESSLTESEAVEYIKKVLDEVKKSP